MPDDVLGKAYEFVERCRELGITAGRPVYAVAAACIYAASRVTGHPLYLAEIVEATPPHHRFVRTTIKVYRLLVTGLEIRVFPPDRRSSWRDTSQSWGSATA